MQNSATGINSIHGENNLGFYERLPNIKAADTLKILNEGEPPVVTVTKLENGAKRYTVTFPKTTIDGPELHNMVDTMLHLRHRIGRIVMPFDSKSNALRANMADWRGPQFIPDLGKVSVIDNKTIKVGDRLYMILWDPENNSFFIRKGTQKITPVISFDVDSQGNYKWNFDTTEGDALAGMLLWTYLHRDTTCQKIPDKLEMEITSRAGEKRKVTQEIKAAQMPLLATMMGDFILEKTKQDLALLVG